MIPKSEKISYPLISGSFQADDARQVLLTLVNDKISFHERNDWSHQERFGEKNPAVLKRIEELHQTREDLVKMLDDVATSGVRLNIQCNIEITLESD
jgi:hypothetical protein